MPTFLPTRLRPILAGTAMALLLPAMASAAEVNVYTTREPGLIQPLFDAFKAKTGISVNAIFVKDGLTERVKAEGANSPADLLINVDFGKLIEAVEAGVSQPVQSDKLTAAVPEQLRDPAGHWYALSMRARVVYADKEDVKDQALNYEDLSDPKWKGQICIRSGQHPYNTALIAAYIAHYGEQKAEAWLQGVKANLARKPAGGDREGARDILAGSCDLAIGNTYYVGLMRNSQDPEQRKWGSAIRVILPTFKSGGTHVNVSGAVVAKHAPNKKEAQTLLEFLVSPEAQALYAKVNYEYPIAKGVEIEPSINELGTLKPDTVSLVEVAKHRKAASLLVDKVRFDN